MHTDNIIYYSTALLPVKADLENDRLREKDPMENNLKGIL